MDPSSSSLLHSVDEMSVINYTQTVIEEKLETTTGNQRTYIDNIAIESQSKMLIDISKNNTMNLLYRDLGAAIEQYKSLEEDWDGYGAAAPTREIIDAAIELVRKLKIKNFKAPKPMLSGSGELGLYWKNNSVYIEISIDEPRNYSLYIEEGTSYNGKADISISDRLPEELRVALDKFNTA